MIRHTTRKNTGPAGIADVRVLKTALRVHFKEDGQLYEVALDGWDGRQDGLYSITLDKGGNKVAYVSPPGRPEPYLVRFKEFGNRASGAPETKIDPGGPRTTKDGRSWYASDRLVASAKLEVVEDSIYNGLIIPYKLPYIFVPEPGTALAGFEGTRGEMKKWDDFLTLAGFNVQDEEIPFSVNVLPWLEAALQVKNAIFQVTLNDHGFVDTLSGIPKGLLPPKMLKSKSNGSKKPAAGRKAKGK